MGPSDVGGTVGSGFFVGAGTRVCVGILVSRGGGGDVGGGTSVGGSSVGITRVGTAVATARRVGRVVATCAGVSVGCASDCATSSLAGGTGLPVTRSRVRHARRIVRASNVSNAHRKSAWRNKRFTGCCTIRDAFARGNETNAPAPPRQYMPFAAQLRFAVPLSVLVLTWGAAALAGSPPGP